MESSTLAELIQQLELKLLQTDLTAHPALIDELLAEDFEEIDNQGEIRSRADVINWLKTKSSGIRWVFKDFRIKVISENVTMAIYSLQKPDQTNNKTPGSIRTSLWRRQGEHWKMIFHQATKITGASAS